jgi:hypothetical protein
MSNVNCRLAGISALDGKAITATSYDGNMTADNLLNPTLQLKWRSLNLQPQVFTIDLLDIDLISYFLIYNHNLTYQAEINFKAALDVNFTNVVINETFPAVLPLYGIGMYYGMYYGGYSNQNWDIKHTVQWLPKAFARYIKVTITDSANPDGYLEIGRMKAGNYFEGQFNMNWGYARDLINNDRVTESDSGARFVEERTPQKSFSLGFSYLNAEDEQAIYEMQRKCGKKRDIFFSAYPLQNTSEERLHEALTFFDSWQGVSRNSVPFRASGMVLKESI